MSHYKFHYTDDSIFEHALKKIGEGKLLTKSPAELTEEERDDLETLKEEYARLKSIHIKDHGKKTGHSKSAKLEPIPKEMETSIGTGWFYEPSDLHSWGTTHPLDTYTMPDGKKIVKLNSEENIRTPDGHVIYLTEKSDEICVEDASQECTDKLFRDFCIQAAIICGLKHDIVKNLKDHYDDLKSSTENLKNHESEYKPINVERVLEQNSNPRYNSGFMSNTSSHYPGYGQYNSTGIMNSMQPLMNQVENLVTQGMKSVVPQITDTLIKKLIK